MTCIGINWNWHSSIISCIVKYKIQYYWNKRSARIGYNGFLFSHEYVSFSAWLLMRKKKPVIFNTGNFFCFNNNVSNLYNNSVIEKTNGMSFNPTTTLKLIYCLILIYHQSIVHSRKNVKYYISLCTDKPDIFC